MLTEDALDSQLAKGAFGYNAEAVRFYTVPDKMMAAVRDLSYDLLMIEAKGDYAAAKTFIETFNKMDEGLTKALDKVKHVPIDIRPHYEAESYLSQR